MIAYDNSDNFVSIFGGVTSVSYTCATGSSLFVVGSSNTTTATYNGVNMTLVINFVPSISDGNQQPVKVFWLANPTPGSHTLDTVVTGDETIGIVSYTGLSTAIQPEASNTAFSNNGLNNTQVVSLATSVATLTDNAWTVLFSVGSANRTFVAGIGTLRTTNDGQLLARAVGIIDSNSPISPAGNSTLQADWSSGSGFLSVVIFSISPEDNSLIGQMMIL